jgi:hypothetical protein
MAKVAFITHVSEDAAIAATITDHLERNGDPCWLAPREATPGSDYSAEIIGAIEASAVFILVLSECLKPAARSRHSAGRRSGSKFWPM